jgi:PH domain
MDPKESKNALAPPSNQARKWSIKGIFSTEKKEDVVGGGGEMELPADEGVKKSEGLQKKKSISSFFTRTPSKKTASSSKVSVTDLPIVSEPIDNDKSSPSKQLSKLSTEGETPSVDISKETSRKATIVRVLSNATTPLFSWLRAPSAQQDTGGAGHVVNPMLHMATFAMHLQDEDSPQNSSKAPIAVGTGLLSTDFWDENDEDSSVESFDEDANETKPKLTISADSSPSRESAEKLSIDKKLQLVFELPEVEKYLKELACWLVRSVLLKGYMYITEHHICFYSSLPNIPGPVRKEGFLQRRSLKRPRSVFYTYWFVLKTDGLYIYSDAKQLYYPKSTIYLKNVLSVTGDAESQAITLVTTNKKYTFKGDTLQQMNEWVSAINAAVFNSKTSGNDVRVVLPYDCISDISIIKNSFNGDSLRVLVVVDESFQPEEVFFY